MFICNCRMVLLSQCEAGHPACGACHAQLRKDRCYSCGCDGTYRRNTTLEDVLSSHRILCPYERYGCRASIAYHEAGDHQLKCPWAPCSCSEPDCTFVGSPSMLCDHLAAAPHSWPVEKIRYGSAFGNVDLSVRVPRRLLVAEEDGRVFLVSSVPMGLCFRGASVVCIRGSAAAGPKYKCAISSIVPESSNGPRLLDSDIFSVQTSEVPSCSEPGEAKEQEMVLLVVRDKSLPQPLLQMSFSVTIDRVLPA
jgi:E3 ubiquitin-protein ligase SIAH1